MDTRLSYPLAIFLVLNILFTIHGAKRNVVVDFTKVEIDNRLPNVIAMYSWINRTSSNISALYMNFKFSEDVYNLTGTFKLNVKFNEKFINYFTLDFDYCKGREMLYSQYVAQILEKQLLTVSNYPLDCPLKKNYEYYVKGFTVDTNLIPGYFAKIFFLSNLTFYRNLQTGINIVITGQVRSK
ncbi:uncharacterized protein LOC133836714 [Drosophila sulfurigaster albostrigata]|uniref:uncharacterized protein LOC133836714 n=1 Tax=Drosophila sulfurigaster albostrigata TaxID=89887 RepID=UPI002D21DAF6|nr:uncharacterized protein LOC133836714 [Drosophila sulfurigaster albostrigata]